MQYRQRVLILLCLLTMVSYVDRVGISVLRPVIQNKFGIGPARWGWVTGVFFLTYGAFGVASGYRGDQKGTRGVLTFIALWGALFTSFTGMAFNYASLLLARCFLGVGEAGVFPNVAATISRWFPANERARPFGWVLMCAQTGGAIATVLAIVIQDRYGWRACFIFFASLAVSWAAMWQWWYRDNPTERTGITAAELDAVRPQGVPPPRRLPWKLVLRSPQLWLIGSLGFSYFYAMSFYQSWLHTFLERGRGFSRNEMFASALPFVCGAVSNLLGGFANDALANKAGLKVGRRTVGFSGLLIAAAAMFATRYFEGQFAAIVFLALGYAGITWQQPAVFAVCVDVGRRYSGTLVGAMNTGAQIGSFVASVLFG